jgi:hypothetical protein
MSLQLAAQHLASRGRGPDTQLIHMAPQEVAGLHALAKAHGGSLTTNPDTGLPEAGFLSSILPMVIGAALAPFTGGLSAALITGAGYTAATGSLKKGLMAGMGAFGGAGLAGGLMGAGAGAAQNAAMAAVPEGAGAGLTSGMELAALENPAVAGFERANLGAASSSLGSTAANTTGIPGFAGSTVGLTPASSAVSAQQAVLQAAPQTFTAAPELTHQGMLNEAAARATPGTELYKAAGTSPFDTAKAGFGEVMKRPGDFLTKDNLKYGLMGLAPVAMDMMTPKQQAEKEKLKPYEYEFSLNPTGAASGYRPIGSPSGYDSSEMQHFDPRFVRKAAGGGLMDINPIEAMSQQNQSQMRPAYAAGGVNDMSVDAYTGAENFAEGGETKAVKPVEQDPYYTMTGQSGDVFKYLMGQGAKPAAPVQAPAPAAAAVQAQPTGPGQSEMQRLTSGMLKGNKFLQSGLNAIVNATDPNAVQPGQGGEWVDDTSNLIKSYTFDPATGGFTSVAAPKVFRPFTPATTQDTYGGGYANGGIASLAQGGQSHLGDYSDGGRLLRGPGDGVSDSIPASIGDKRPARLADGEFVVSADVVSGLGNGSTEAGARKLYAMMDRVRKARTGTKKMGKTVNSDRLVPV